MSYKPDFTIDSVRHKTLTQCLKFESAEAYEKAKTRLDDLFAHAISTTEVPGIIELKEVEGNILLNEGINSGIWPLVCGGSATAFNNANARIGVGDSDVAESATQTDLQGTNKTYKGMDSGYPTYGTNQKATWQATFGETEANYAWKEWCIDNGAAAGVTLNRKVENLGTKTTGVWVLRVSITLS